MAAGFTFIGIDGHGIGVFIAKPLIIKPCP
jgi:hypothetical protein